MLDLMRRDLQAKAEAEAEPKAVAEAK